MADAHRSGFPADRGPAMGRPSFRRELAVRVRDQSVGAYRSLGVLRIFFRPDPSHSRVQGSLLHHATHMDRARRYRVSLLPASGRHLRASSNAVLCVQHRPLPDSENDREPASRCPRSFAHGAPLLFLVERRLALHGWRGEYLSAVDALLRHFCVQVRALKTMADRGRSVRGHGDLLPVLPDRVRARGAGLCSFCEAKHRHPMGGALESFRLGLRHNHVDFRRVQHGGEWTVPVLH